MRATFFRVSTTGFLMVGSGRFPLALTTVPSACPWRGDAGQRGLPSLVRWGVHCFPWCFVRDDLFFLFHTGPSHMSFYVRTHKGSTLSQWSLGNGTPVTSKGGDYFVFYSHGLQASAWRFWIEVQVGAPALLRPLLRPPGGVWDRYSAFLQPEN